MMTTMRLNPGTFPFLSRLHEMHSIKTVKVSQILGLSIPGRLRFLSAIYHLAFEAGSYKRCSSSSIQLKPLQYSALRSNRFVAIVGTVSKTVVDQHRVKL